VPSGSPLFVRHRIERAQDARSLEILAEVAQGQAADFDRSAATAQRAGWEPEASELAVEAATWREVQMAAIEKRHRIILEAAKK
jgi:hypothetical protein